MHKVPQDLNDNVNFADVPISFLDDLSKSQMAELLNNINENFRYQHGVKGEPDCDYTGYFNNIYVPLMNLIDNYNCPHKIFEYIRINHLSRPQLVDVAKKIITDKISKLE